MQGKPPTHPTSPESRAQLLNKTETDGPLSDSGPPTGNCAACIFRANVSFLSTSHSPQWPSCQKNSAEDGSVQHGAVKPWRDIFFFALPLHYPSCYRYNVPAHHTPFAVIWHHAAARSKKEKKPSTSAHQVRRHAIATDLLGYKTWQLCIQDAHALCPSTHCYTNRTAHIHTEKKRQVFSPRRGACALTLVFPCTTHASHTHPLLFLPLLVVHYFYPSRQNPPIKRPPLWRPFFSSGGRIRP